MSAAVTPAMDTMCSRTTGFFFCGMIDEPWVYAVGVSTHLNVIHSSSTREKRAPVAVILAWTAASRIKCSAPATAS